MLRRSLAFAAACLLALPVAAQVQRNFPQNALRGAVVFGEAPEISLNGRPARLAPGTRIRDASNMTVVPSAVYGGRFLVHYTIDPFGLVKDIWILTPEEAANKPWPSTPDEAAEWSFDPVAQVWTKP
ncbi:MAG: hypothetical protein ACXWCU_01090 [Caldimonas sp.]